LGGVFGGIFRLAPEVLKFFDKKNERLHEMAMFSRQCELEQIRGQQKLAEIGAQREAAVMLVSWMPLTLQLSSKQQWSKPQAAGRLVCLHLFVLSLRTGFCLIWSLAHFWYAWTGYRTGLAN
jgi:hypothetical protein